jgi:hypothetical protein
MRTRTCIDFDDSAWRRLDLPHDWSIEATPGRGNPAGAGGGNLLAVRIDNSRQRNSRWHTGSGILCLAIVQAGRSPGAMEIRATADGLAPASAVVTVE